MRTITLICVPICLVGIGFAVATLLSSCSQVIVQYTATFPDKSVELQILERDDVVYAASEHFGRKAVGATDHAVADELSLPFLTRKELISMEVELAEDAAQVRFISTKYVITYDDGKSDFTIEARARDTSSE